ncbi:HAMP domain-containing histidine kinase [Streptomyces olivaceus]|uniref:histidine kinase n=2 Tax=Streptomyces olivaceus TaxID=47716 RepID=A0ABS7W3Y2_STROV|nr:HAMP domain-containing histidine kinase [Streptomyces olivaceus]MBZ6098489.1 HAMP domain-containing histidine kinase [Streptomyces olivaceus]MBZ6119292.1 HAMP domain-containing histidine kinase [Streptomyces olivaceus]MBZ6151975.1 HAMP domain-containing histidine kinase [Streptomyces olivaceus]MBZ6300526.1 HAMP domain-containing histidine kinase [Streptomyces olivaceus]
MDAQSKRLSLRVRLGLLAAVAVALAVSAASVVSWVATRHQLRSQLDSNLRSVVASAGYVRQLLTLCGTSIPSSGEADRTPTPYTIQLVTSDGTVCAAPGGEHIAVGNTDLAVARGTLSGTLHDARTENGKEMRVATSRPDLPPGTSGNYAVSIAQPLNVVEGPLNSLALLLLTVTGVGVLGAATAGVAIARSGLRPVEQLTGTAEHIARTEDLAVRIPVDGKDEIARLSQSFNSMTEALATSRDRQQQLIADAGHELRTPLTSLRTNIELLVRSEKSGRKLPEGVRSDLLTSITAQIGELASLIGDLQELSRSDARSSSSSFQAVAFHQVTERALSRAKLRGANLHFSIDLQEWYVWAEPVALERAIVNLLDNAIKFSPNDATVTVRLDKGQLSIRDEGPGIGSTELPHVFDRFWRSPSARSLPGSGLGLAIVAKTVKQSGGTVSLQSREESGTEALMCMPGSPKPPPGGTNDG